MTKILIVGTSHATPDANYLGIHWSEKILDHNPDYEILNFAIGGSTNAMINFQLHQGLRFNPDFVIMLFSTPERFVVDNDSKAKLPALTNHMDVVDYNFKRYTTTSLLNQKSPEYDIFSRFVTLVNSQEFDVMDTYFHIEGMMNLLEQKDIPFCFSWGGAPPARWSQALDNNFILNDLGRFEKNRVITNLTEHSDFTDNAPAFHVTDPAVHQQFANECILHIEKVI